MGGCRCACHPVCKPPRPRPPPEPGSRRCPPGSDPSTCAVPVNRHTLARLGGAAQQADHLARFRADAIVRDAEAIRRTLIHDEPWTVLGQSFGGYCATTYLSFAPQGLRQVLITGGLPGLRADADDAYRALYPTVAAKNAEHYERYPEDIERVRQIARHLRDHDVRLPSGRQLTIEAFQSLGNLLGAATGSRQLHYLLEDPFTGSTHLSDAFLLQVDSQLSWASANPLYFLLHEATYAQTDAPTGWSAQRTRTEFPRFDATAALEEGAPILFTGEMIYPWLFDNDPLLRPLRDVADRLADRRTWTPLYDVSQLAANTVPVAAAVYANDM